MPNIVGVCRAPVNTPVNTKERFCLGLVTCFVAGFVAGFMRGAVTGSQLSAENGTGNASQRRVIIFDPEYCMSRLVKNIVSSAVLAGFLAACGPVSPMGYQLKLQKNAAMGSDARVMAIETVTAIGYAVVSTQPGRTDAQRRLMAIRAARMAAMRDLAEQIHGLKVDGNTTVVDLMVQNDTFRGVVTGVIRGARTVRINPTGEDTYEIVLELDRSMISDLMQSARRFS